MAPEIGETAEMARVFNTVVAAHDPQMLAAFWGQALGYRLTQSQDGLARISPPPTVAGPHLLFLKSDNIPSGSVIHLDLASSDPLTEVQRLLKLGASLADPSTNDDVT